jgi:hypothetical protein
MADDVYGSQWVIAVFLYIFPFVFHRHWLFYTTYGLSFAVDDGQMRIPLC